MGIRYIGCTDYWYCMLNLKNILNFHIQTVLPTAVADVFISNQVYKLFRHLAIKYCQISAGKIGIYKLRTKECPETPVFTLRSS